MRVLKTILRTFAALVAAVILSLVVSFLVEHEGDETVAAFSGLRITVTGIGAGLALLTFLLFATLKAADLRRQGGENRIGGVRMDAVGFGLLPGIAVWKIFEQSLFLAQGKKVFEPLPEFPYLTAEGYFAPSRIEMILAVLIFTWIVIWLSARKRDLTGKGDLLLTVVCVWAMVRVLTEEYRAVPLITAGNVNLIQLLLLAGADVCLLIWTIRNEETEQRSTAFSVLEWITVLSCEAVLILNAAGVLTAGSQIGDLAVKAGCVILCLLLMMFSGKDCREDRGFTDGSDNPAYYS